MDSPSSEYRGLYIGLDLGLEWSSLDLSWGLMGSLGVSSLNSK